MVIFYISNTCLLVAWKIGQRVHHTRLHLNRNPLDFYIKRHTRVLIQFSVYNPVVFLSYLFRELWIFYNSVVRLHANDIQSAFYGRTLRMICRV